MYTIRHTLLGNIRTFFMSDVLAAKPAQATEMSVADLKALFDFTPTSGELILPYPSEANKTTLTKADFDKIKALVTADNAKDAIRELSLIKKASTPANELSVVLAEVQKAAAPEVQKAKVSNDIEKTAIKDTATIARDTVHTSAADVAQTRSRYENRLNFNDIMDIFQKNPDFFKNISKNDMYISTDTETKQVVQTPLMVGLTKLGYISREQYMNNSGNNYTTKELSAIVSLRDEIL